MKKYVDIVLKGMLSLILLLPVVGLLDVMPAPTRDLYHTDRAFQFIQILMDGRYVNIMMGVACALALYFMWTRRTALAMLLILPITLNIAGFHAFLDGGPFTSGAVPGIVFLLLNLYFLWQSRAQYRSLLNRA